MSEEIKRGGGNSTPPVDELKPEVANDTLVDETLQEWNGKHTAIKLARGLIRDNQLVGPGVPCIDCGSKEHNFHLRASKDRQGRWQGPEATHAVDLIASGVVDGTAAKRARDVQQAAVEVERGVHAPLEVDAEGKVVRRPFPELAELTMRDHQRQWHSVLQGGPEAVTDRERAERREAVGEQEKAIAALGKGLRQAIFGDADPAQVFAGAGLAKAVGEVPITNADGTPRQKPGPKPKQVQGLPTREEE